MFKVVTENAQGTFWITGWMGTHVKLLFLWIISLNQNLPTCLVSSCVGTLQTTDFSIVSVEGVLVSGYFFLEPKLAYSLPWYTFSLLPSWSGFIVSDFLAPIMRQQIGRRAKFRSSWHLQDNKAASALAVSLNVEAVLQFFLVLVLKQSSAGKSSGQTLTSVPWWTRDHYDI